MHIFQSWLRGTKIQLQFTSLEYQFHHFTWNKIVSIFFFFSFFGCCRLEIEYFYLGCTVMELQQKMATRPFHPTLGHNSIVPWSPSPGVLLSHWDWQHWGFHDVCGEDEEIVLWSEEDPQAPACSTKHRQPIHPTGKWNEPQCDKWTHRELPHFLGRRKPHIRKLLLFQSLIKALLRGCIFPWHLN